MIRKFAKADILDVRYSSTRLKGNEANERFSKLAKPKEVTEDGYLYVITRAISSRVNKNDDGWPSLELARTDRGYGYKTFEGRPIFVDHNNDDPDRTRGIVVSSKLHVDEVKKASAFDPYYANAPEEHLPPTWIELMLEVDAKEYPKLAKEIIKGNIDSVSMGANIELSKCSVCGHEAENPTEYCSHVKMKGATFEVTSENGEKSHKKAYEDCYGINFFEISFVFDPADETALVSDMSAEREAALTAVAALESAGAPVPEELRKQAAGVFEEDDEDPRGGPVDYEQRAEEEEPHSPMEAPDESEDQKVYKWNMHILVDEMGATPEQAATFLAQGGDYHELEAFLKQYPRADLDSAMNIVSSVEKKGIGPDGRDHHNLDQHRQDVERERQLNYEPQAEKMRAPQDVDTLRPEIICKNCGSTVEPDSAGQLICQECGVEVEPEGLDNPDLELARDTDLRQDKTEEVNPEGEMETELEEDKGETEVPAKNPVRPVAPISSTQSDPVRDEMKIIAADSKVVNRIVSFMTKAGIEVEDEVELARILTESKEFEGTPTIYDAAEAIELKVAATQDNADPKDTSKVVTDKKNPSTSPSAQTASERVISDQHAPVESAKFEVLAETESTETSNEDTTMEKEKTSDRETIKRVEEDGSGVKRTEEITKEFGPMADGGEELAEGEEAAPEEGAEEAPEEGAEGEESAEAPLGQGDGDEVQGEESPEEEHKHDPLKEEEKVPAMANSEGKLMAALRLAKVASSLGVISADDELEYAGELESTETIEEINARAKMLESVKEAGLARKRRPVIAGRVPSFKSSSSLGSDDDDGDDEALFL